MFAMLFITYIVSVISQSDTLISAIIRDNELISTYQSWSLYNTKVRVFEIKEGTTADIFNSGNTFDYGPTSSDFALEFLDIPDNFQGGKNKLWVRFKFQDLIIPISLLL
ncbi:hypothetical protein CONCODRAFT_1918 [Conidiobolus coronatus NRRL 28638]|uniref:Uncharacterized protein n=1 Tax=Conidiobolus coronatus (strain ATCC 28846 / CBS 209.66 / NRRL 28638) TaxID=796925 RepID=A0A137PIN1_CONC2|nr:hypothetical protein CONCODRAFT_1918 [Conidiobolus coronatus NRRL 28638]|eukprot:KXN74853.1 hypothetical protein CONCODRAFT_1918 [Conidiobolus coronatus NRRL 28638]